MVRKDNDFLAYVGKVLPCFETCLNRLDHKQASI